ncbi:MAG: phosphate ABC transporter substrate-binding protein [Lentisphaeria bacterium]|nr:phosphate ABC transporter substrate-binding protein [Lentisphaeria bacterium]
MVKKLGLYVGALLACTIAQAGVDENLPVYKPVSGVSGKLNSIGSDTLNNLMTLWAESFQKMYPNVKIQIEGKGSSTAPPALIEGTSQLGPMSREMKSKEIDKFESKFNYKPTPIGVAIDALAVFVNKDNPVAGLSLTQVDAMFSSTRKRGGSEITKWGQIGIDSLKDSDVSLYGRNSASGTYGFFGKVALAKGDYKKTVKEQPGSSAVVAGVGENIGAIGYSGIGYKTASVRALPLSKEGKDFKEPTAKNCLNGTYPLSRVLFVYINKSPEKPVDKLTYEFLRFVLSKQGQEIVEKDGYYPLPAAPAAKYLEGLK